MSSTPSGHLAYEHVAASIRSQILAGAIRPGDRLPVEADLAAEYGVSRSTIREALRTLASQRLVVTLRGTAGGSFVGQPEHDAVYGPIETGIGFLAGADAISVQELLEARELLEVPAARLAAARRSPEDVETILDALHETRTSDLSSTYESSRNFHVLILQATGNLLLEMMTRPIFSVLRTRFLRDEAPKSFWRKVAMEHFVIAEAIEAGDPKAAGEEMLRHLVTLSDTYSQIDRLRRSESTRT